MAKSKLTKCKACGAEIAKSAKSCPHCGARNKKSVFKRWWFWLLVIVLLGTIGNPRKHNKQKVAASSSTNPGQSISHVKTDTPAETVATEPKVIQTEASVTEEAVPTDDSGEINPEFKAAMDAYEAFYAEYCDLMKKYMANPTNLSLLTKYAEMMSKAE